MLPKPVVSRRDIVSRESYPKEELFRLVKSDKGVILDIDQNLNGRGIYVKKDIETLKKLREKKAYQRYRIPENIIRQMEELLSSAE